MTIMKRTILFISLLLSALVPLQAQRLFKVEQPQFEEFFKDARTAIYFYREGNRQNERVYLRSDKAPIVNMDPRVSGGWAGSKTQLLDPVDNGDYRLMLVDEASGREIYSRTFNNLFHEYRDTPAGKDSVARFEEVMYIPTPKRSALLCLQRRDDKQRFFTEATFHLDSYASTTDSKRPYVVRKLQYKGEPSKKIDVVIIGEGYGIKDRKKYEQDLQNFKEYLFASEPFKSRRDDFNVWAVEAFAKESGITDPTKDKYVNSVCGSSYNTFGIARYLMTMEVFKMHSYLRYVPFDHILIMANSETYGGGGIYNFYSMTATVDMARYVLPHELGHSIGGLADEYVDTQVSYNDMHKEGWEPVEPNITSLVDFDSKWKDMLPANAAIPTPACMDAVKFTENCGELGVYEGGGYKPKGIYRPMFNCMMNYYAPFCPVCQRALNFMFDLYTR